MFDDDNFWVKLDRDDDEIEFMNNSPTYNGSKYRKNTSLQTSKVNDTQSQSNRVVPVTCNVDDDASHFNKTKIGKILLSLSFVLSMLMYVFLLLTIIFAIREKVVFIAFAICCGLACVGLAFTCWLRAKLNRKYKEQLLEKEKQKIENKKKNKITKVDKQK